MGIAKGADEQRTRQQVSEAVSDLVKVAKDLESVERVYDRGEIRNILTERTKDLGQVAEIVGPIGNFLQAVGDVEAASDHALLAIGFEPQFGADLDHMDSLTQQGEGAAEVLLTSLSNLKVTALETGIARVGDIGDF